MKFRPSSTSRSGSDPSSWLHPAVNFEPRIDRLVAAVAKAEEAVESLASRMEFVASSEVPLAGEHRGVTEALEQLRPGDRRAGASPTSGSFEGRSNRRFPARRVAAGQESCARRRADRGDRECVAEDRPARARRSRLGVLISRLP